MTLRQVVKRIEKFALAHKQLRNFYFGSVTDFLTEKTTRYASCFLQENGGQVDINQKQLQINFRLFLLDLVHVSENAKDNELDVQSDMLSVCLDLLAEFDYSGYVDWKVTTSSSIQVVREELDDLVAGVVSDITIIVPYLKDVCAVPTNPVDIIPNDEDMKLVYDEKYVATGNEATGVDGNGNPVTYLDIPAIKGKKILLVTREFTPLYKVSSNPDSVEFVWDNDLITVSNIVNPNERFLILYRNY